jgi:single-stranded DNA-binding protein
MSSIKATFTGTIVAEPQLGETKNGIKKLEFPVYVNHARKNKDTGTWSTTGDVSKIRVTLWAARSQEDFRMGDLVEVTCTLIEKEFTKRDGTAGRSLQTDYIENVVLKHRKDGNSLPALKVGGFDEDSPF